jgi:hypothetical protein
MRFYPVRHGESKAEIDASTVSLILVGHLSHLSRIAPALLLGTPWRTSSTSTEARWSASRASRAAIASNGFSPLSSSSRVACDCGSVRRAGAPRQSDDLRGCSSEVS